VIGYGRITVYEPREITRSSSTTWSQRGSGALQLAFEQLKEKLAAKVFSIRPAKNRFPHLPKRSGSSPRPRGGHPGILRIIDRRFANIHVVLFSGAGAGQGAAQEIAQALRP